MPTLMVPTGSIYYTDKKQDASPYPPLVLVHGAGGTHLDWSPELRRLPNARVIALDLPGHGKSSGSGRTDTLAYAQDVCAVLDALTIPRAIIAGHSMGGAVAQQMALHLPDRVAGLILVGTGSKLPVEPTLPQRIIDDTARAVDWLIEGSWSPDAPAAMKERGRQNLLNTRPEVLRGDYLACMAFDVRDRLEQITVPTLVLAATGDRMVKFKFGVTLAERIPKATLVEIHSDGHMFPLEQAQAVAEAVRHWLAGQTWET